MLWRIPLVALVSLFLVVSCDQRPFEPIEDDAAATPIFSPKSNANKFVWDFDDEWSEVCSGGQTIDATMVGWGQFMSKKSVRTLEVDVFHLVFTFTYGGDTFVYRDVGPDHWYCTDSDCFVSVTGRSSASGTTDRDEINIGHAVMRLDGPFGDPVEVVFIAGRGLGTLTDMACDALT